MVACLQFLSQIYRKNKMKVVERGIIKVLSGRSF